MFELLNSLRGVVLFQDLTEQDLSVTELVLEEGLLSREQLEDILKPERMTAPRS